jgi:hypothetical protein
MPALWDLPDFDAHESVHLFDDPKTGLRAVIAIHSTHLGRQQVARVSGIMLTSRLH